MLLSVGADWCQARKVKQIYVCRTTCFQATWAVSNLVSVDIFQVDILLISIYMFMLYLQLNDTEAISVEPRCLSASPSLKTSFDV